MVNRPSLAVYLPNVANCKSTWKWVAWINHKLIDARDPCGAADGGDYRLVRTNLRLFNEPTCEECAENAFVDEILIQAELTARVECCHFGAGACAAGRAVDDTCPGGGFVPVDLAC